VIRNTLLCMRFVYANLHSAGIRSCLLQGRSQTTARTCSGRVKPRLFRLINVGAYQSISSDHPQVPSDSRLNVGSGACQNLLLEAWWIPGARQWAAHIAAYICPLPLSMRGQIVGTWDDSEVHGVA
jgi:hypothetical protein